MSIVLNEYIWAEKKIREHDLGTKPGETLVRVAKYYLKDGYSKRDTQTLLERFLITCDPNTSIPRWTALIDRAIKSAAKYPIVNIDHIDVTEPEIRVIESLGSVQLKRLAFTLLAVAKYWDTASPRNNHWVNCPDKEIMAMANINTSIKRQSELFGRLRELGMIRFSKKVDNLNVQVTFIEDGKAEIPVSDYRNLGNQYMMHFGGPFYECQNCGIVVRESKMDRRGRHPKYCPSCAIEIKTRQNVESVMRGRNIKN